MYDKKILNDILCDIRVNNKITELMLSKKYYYSERTIRRYIKKLKDDKKIVLVGSGREKQWRIL